MEILTNEQMAQADKITIEEFELPSIVLMENAAKSLFQVFQSLEIPTNKNIALIIGKGNNGGDGLALSRYLIEYGYNTTIYILAKKDELKGNPLHYYKYLTHQPSKLIHLNESSISNVNFFEYDIIFDGIFGTGLSRPAEGFYKIIIEKINQSKATIISIDIPSGLSGNTSSIIGEHIYADYTITFCRPKIVHTMYPSRKYCGTIYVTDISIPDNAVTKTTPNLFLIDKDNLPIIKKRELDAHKGHFGHTVIIGGSLGKTGAAILASMSASRIGAGLTTCVIPKKLNKIIKSTLIEQMSFPVGNKDYFTKEEAQEVINFISDKSVVAIGPGIGRNENTGNFVKEIIKNSNKPLVIDADGLNLLDKEILKDGYLRNRAILTPHIGEFSRLIKKTKDNILSNKVELAQDFATRYQLILVLKSADTLIATPDGTCYINIEGSPSLSKGGSGDCLTGMIAGFISQGYSLKDSAILSTFIMGKTAKYLSSKYNENTILTKDIINNLWVILNEITLYQREYRGYKKDSIKVI
ncbi:MAG: NAD(P)H-hydrate dehydratase [Deferribacterota bacterium]|nr:NAD(P)H-hydrate dehydratase [Deferribacterota bacterium]